jgi:hypothetical protein
MHLCVHTHLFLFYFHFSLFNSTNSSVMLFSFTHKNEEEKRERYHNIMMLAEIYLQRLKKNMLVMILFHTENVQCIESVCASE